MNSFTKTSKSLYKDADTQDSSIIYSGKLFVSNRIVFDA